MHRDHSQSAEAFAKKYNIRHKLAVATCHKLLSEIRADPVIGKWSLSVIDECWSDEEILETLCCQESDDDSGTLIPKDLFPSVAEAKKILRALHRSFLDRQEEIFNA